MGFHYAAKKDLPFGPIDGWYKGKPIFTEGRSHEPKFEAGTRLGQPAQVRDGTHGDHVGDDHGGDGFPQRADHWLTSGW